MELVEAHVDTVASALMGWKETLLMPIGDAHYGSDSCDDDRLQRHIAWGVEHGAYFLGMGDYLDIASPSNRMRLKSANLYDSVEDFLEEAMERLIEDFLKLTKGSEGRWLGLLEGHHFYEFRDGTTSDMRLAQALKAPFLGSCAFVRLHFKRETAAMKSPVLTATIWCHHGAGAGIKQSAPLNKLENLFGFFDADIYLVGHQHKKVAAPIDQLYMTRVKPFNIRHRTKIIACTGGFLKGYMANSKIAGRPQGNYVEKHLFNPVGLGGVLIRLRPVHTTSHSKSEERIDLSVEL